jgi:HAD superfamily hydrolase (TIGR01509 family)
MPPPAAVIFDFDGIIIDSEVAEFESHRQLYQRFGVQLTVDEWCAHVGYWSEQHDESWARKLSARSLTAPSTEIYLLEQRRMFLQLLPLQPMVGIRELLVELSAASIQVAIGSTSPSSWVIPSLETFGLLRKFSAVVTGEQVDRPKPAPDIYLEAARRLSILPSEALVIEDSAPGVAAAKAASMRVVAIPNLLTERHDLTAADLRVSNASQLTLGTLRSLYT